MADEDLRRPPGRGRRERSPRREAVPADPTGGYDDWWTDDEGDEGSAGVREPRRPTPLGPRSGAGALPEPEPPVTVSLPDARY